MKKSASFLVLLLLTLMMFSSCNISGKQLVYVMGSSEYTKNSTKINDIMRITEPSSGSLEIIARSSSQVSNKEKEKILKELDNSLDDLFNSIEGYKK